LIKYEFEKKTEQPELLGMDTRESFIKEVMKIKNIQTRKELCRAVGYCGTYTKPLRDWEHERTRRFDLQFEQYLARWHDDDLAKLSLLPIVFPYLEPLRKNLTLELTETNNK
jgi:hypothetical protein